MTSWRMFGETDYQAITSIPRKLLVLVCQRLYSGTWQTRRPHQFHGTSQGWHLSLVSGYSKNSMTLFLEDKGTMTPESVMEAAISDEECSKLVVLD